MDLIDKNNKENIDVARSSGTTETQNLQVELENVQAALRSVEREKKESEERERNHRLQLNEMRKVVQEMTDEHSLLQQKQRETAEALTDSNTRCVQLENQNSQLRSELLQQSVKIGELRKVKDILCSVFNDEGTSSDEASSGVQGVDTDVLGNLGVEDNR